MKSINTLKKCGVTRHCLYRNSLTLGKRWQRAKVSLNFSSWSELILGKSQGYALRAVLFNISLIISFTLLSQYMLAIMLMTVLFMHATQLYSILLEDWRATNDGYRMVSEAATRSCS